MVALNFTMFVDKVEDGRKRQTIRATTRAYPGCALQLYHGQRTKNCRLLREEICLSVQPVKICCNEVQQCCHTIVNQLQLEEFARADGFETFADMWDFFGKRADGFGVFAGEIIKW